MNASLIRMLLAGAVSLLGASAQAGGGIDTSRLAPVRGEPKPVQRAAPEPPVRAYAIDGASFYYGGRHFVIDGMAPPRAGDELAKQQLQQLLDSGELSVAPVGDVDGALVPARVSIDGTELALPGD